jgi:fructan beta-fructosidase
LFELPVEGETGVSKWVMYDAHGRYVVGKFDGKTFDVEQPFRVYAHGGGYFYASQLFNDTPDGKKIQVGWGRNITNPGMPFNQPMLFPTELKLRRSFDGLRLTPTPIKGISSLHTNSKVIESKIVSGEKVTVETNAKALHVIANIERGDAAISLNVMGFEFRFDNEWMVTTASNEEVKPSVAPAGPFPPPSAAVPVTYVPSGNEIKFEVILDRNIMECFINDGELYYVTAFNGTPTGKVEVGVAGRSQQGRNSNRKFILKKLEVHELDGIWKKQMP